MPRVYSDKLLVTPVTYVTLYIIYSIYLYY
nr:MAG TPA: hypothetical protein [Caudoviricetes sp.]